MGELAIQYANLPEIKKKNSPLQPITTTKSSQTIKSPTDRILFLQKTAGNQAVQRLIKSGILQAKLKIAQPGDKYEQEADRVADEVMQMQMQEPEVHHPIIQRVSFGDDGSLLPTHQSIVREAAEIAEHLVMTDEFRRRWEAFWQAHGDIITPRPSLVQYRSAVRDRIVHDMDSSRREEVRQKVREESGSPLERQTGAVTILNSHNTYIRQFAINQGIDTVVSILLHESLHGAGVPMGPNGVPLYEPFLHRFEAAVGFPMMMGGADILEIRQVRRNFNDFDIMIRYNLRQVSPPEPLPGGLEIQVVDQLAGNVVSNEEPDGSLLPARAPIPSRVGQGRWVWHALNLGCRRFSVRIVSVRENSLLGSRPLILPCEFRVSR